MGFGINRGGLLMPVKQQDTAHVSLLVRFHVMTLLYLLCFSLEDERIKTQPPP